MFSNSFKYFSEIKNLTVAILLLVQPLLMSSAFAVEYFWYIGAESYKYTYGSSAKESCMVTYHGIESNNPQLRNYRFKSLQYHSPGLFYCNYQYDLYHSNGVFAKTFDAQVGVHRYGNECRPNTSSNITAGSCGNDEQKGPPPPQSCKGNPINIAVGNKFQNETDYSAGGNSVLSFSRSYNSLDGIWRNSFSTYMRFGGTQYISLVMANGRESFFTVSGSTITPTSADLGVLSKTSSGWQYMSTSNERFTFDTAGKLTQWSNDIGAVHQFAYAGSQVTVTDNLGNSLTFTEDADRQPLTLTAPGVQIAYSYDSNKRLTSVARTTGGETTQRQFHYEVAGKPNLLTGITDEAGVRYATWAYDNQGRAISSGHAEGADRVGVAYNSDGTVSVTNELGKVAKYTFQYIKGVKRITSIQGEPSANCPNSNSTFTYDTRGLLKTKTDNKGHLTTYDYNTRGLEISRTEAAGTPQARTISTEWHSTLFLPVTVTEPTRITTYTYDAQGRQLSQSVTQR